MFSFRKSRDIITLFHKASSPASTRAVNLLKQASTNASEAANETGAAAADATIRDPFELDIVENPPTTDQVETILEYLKPAEIPQVVKGADTVTEALRRFKQDNENFRRPMVVDWNNGKAVAGDNESEILKLMESRKM